jgi:hypothetical protein
LVQFDPWQATLAGEKTMNEIIGAPKVIDRKAFQAELDTLRVREKAHTHEGDAIAAARRRLPMVEVNGETPIIGERGKVTLLTRLRLRPTRHADSRRGRAFELSTAWVEA